MDEFVKVDSHLQGINSNYEVLSETVRLIPNAVRYSFRRYLRPPNWEADDIGELKYDYRSSEPGQGNLELRFCLTGKMYCNQLPQDCNACKVHADTNCKEIVESIDLLTFVFSSTLLSQFVKSRQNQSNLSDDVLSFKYNSSFTKTVSLCSRTRIVLEGLLTHTYSDSLENIYVNAQTQMLLLYSLDCILGDKEIDTINCKFLANEEDKAKIIKAREILIQHIGNPITIKELSRKVAINECYLKKGFKELFGTTIFDFYQNQRMEHAKYLLYEKGLSVTDVSMVLGYSSISHFSTAFKKHTGLKPCELFR
ncbi:MAG: helix-turn-helix domain-containing protein [Chitinophagaceae bacterium]